MRPSKRDSSDSNRNIHWERRRDAIVEVVDVFDLRHISESANDLVERLAEETHWAYLRLLSRVNKEAGESNAPE